MIFLKTIILLRAFFKSRPCVSWYGSCRLVHNGNRYQSYYHVKYTKYSLYKTNIRTTNSLLLNKAISDKYGLILQYILQKYSTILRRDLIFNIKLYKNNRKIIILPSFSESSLTPSVDTILLGLLQWTEIKIVSSIFSKSILDKKIEWKYCQKWKLSISASIS